MQVKKEASERILLKLDCWFTCTLNPLSIEQTRANILGSEQKSNECNAKDNVQLWLWCQ